MEERKVVIFRLNGEEYASDMEYVERIINYEKPTRIPQTSEYIEGVIRYEGKVIPLLNIKKRFSLGDHEIVEDNKIIVMRHEKGKSAIIVDEVTEIRDISEENMESAPDIIKHVNNEYMLGLIKLNNRIIMLIDYSKISDKNIV